MLVDYFEQEVALLELPHISILDKNNTNKEVSNDAYNDENGC